MSWNYTPLSHSEPFDRLTIKKGSGLQVNTSARTDNPLLRKISTTLLPTPPVAPATRMIPEESIDFTGLLGDGPDSFSLRNSKNFKHRPTLLGVFNTTIHMHRQKGGKKKKKKGNYKRKQPNLGRGRRPVEIIQCSQKSSKVPRLLSTLCKRPLICCKREMPRAFFSS